MMPLQFKYNKKLYDTFHSPQFSQILTKKKYKFHIITLLQNSVFILNNLLP